MGCVRVVRVTPRLDPGFRPTHPPHVCWAECRDECSSERCRAIWLGIGNGIPAQRPASACVKLWLAECDCPTSGPEFASYDRVVSCYKRRTESMRPTRCRRIHVSEPLSQSPSARLQLQLLDALLVYLHRVKRKLIRQTYTQSSARHSHISSGPTHEASPRQYTSAAALSPRRA